LDAIGKIAYKKISDVALMRCIGNPYNVIIKSEALMNISPFLTVNYSCDKTLQWTNQRLQQAGLRSVQTFDLHAARTGLHDCQCPNHGTDECDCQMVVLLVYGDTMEPVTLILHGNDGQTWLSTPEGPTSNAGLKEQVQQVLKAEKLVPNN
jgi:hypothetical protein